MSTVFGEPPTKSVTGPGPLRLRVLVCPLDLSGLHVVTCGSGRAGSEPHPKQVMAAVPEGCEFGCYWQASPCERAKGTYSHLLDHAIPNEAACCAWRAGGGASAVTGALLRRKSPQSTDEQLE